MWDVAIIGAGLSGIVCARRLVSDGYSVCILDKSRGLGGRMATRRVSEQIRVDHGLRYWQAKSEGLQTLTDELVSAGVLEPWRVSEYEIQQRDRLIQVDPDDAPKYIARTGMSAVAKYLLQQPGLNGTPAFEREKTVLTNHRAISLSYREAHWSIGCESGEVVSAKRCAIAIPAPQAADLLKSCLQEASSQAVHSQVEESLKSLSSVRYVPCLTVMAGYKSEFSAAMGDLDPNGWMMSDRIGTSTDWVGLDSSKSGHIAPSASTQSGPSSGPVIVIHSKPKFAHRYLDTSDLQPAASVLLRANARKLGDWIAQPNWFQIHRWRYAQVQAPYSEPVLPVTDTLVCGGDWGVHSAANDDCTGLDHAYASGRALASTLQNLASTRQK